MLKYILLFILKRIIKILNFNKRLITKFAPFKFLYFKIITILLFIKGTFEILKKYTIFRYLNIVLRVISFTSLLINFILFILLMELNIIGWTPQAYFTNNFTWLPGWFTEWITDLWNKISYFFLLIWN